ncbi:hypothetical protein Zm00014a_001155 [Zea mays]|uniref:Uncharacterized protein n=1 Tax=Zea mays TaxID=4577 RepID=A0A3L6FJ38_MAIZE|nr:hypothetical protein Zm00014a_001155 [Zea mays]
MAAEAQAEGPALPPPPLAHGSSSASPEKRGLPIPSDDDVAAAAEDKEQLPEPKRRRACVATLDHVPGAAVSLVLVTEETEDSPGSGSGGGGDGASFSFQHARGGFVALETTPKFGSFNPPGEAELAALDLKHARHEADAEGSTEADDEVPAASAPGAGAEAKGESSQLPGGEVDGQVQTF